MERYIKEYANARIKDIKNHAFMKAYDKEVALKDIEKALFYRERGMLTIDQTIKIILEA